MKNRRQKIKQSNVSEMTDYSRLPDRQVVTGLQQLQKFVKFRQTACSDAYCHCPICKTKKLMPIREYIGHLNRKKANNCLLAELASCLFPRTNKKTLKMYIPDLALFKNGQFSAFYCTNLVDLRVSSPYHIFTERMLEIYLKRHRKAYQESMKLLFEQGIQNNITFNEVHENFSTTILPTHYYQGLISAVDSKTIHHQQRLIVHRNSRLQIQTIDRNSTPAPTDDQIYVVRFTDGNDQMLNETQFNSFLMSRKGFSDLTYIKSYIKPKKIQQFTYQFDRNSNFNIQRHEKAERVVGVLLQQISYYDERYVSQEVADEELEQLREQPLKYIEVAVYRMISYIEKMHHRSTSYLRTRWVLNQLSNYYLNDVLEWEWEQIKPKQQNQATQDHNSLLESINNDEDFFIETYKQTSRHIGKQREKQSMSTMDAGSHGYNTTTIESGPSRRYNSLRFRQSSRNSNVQTISSNKRRFDYEVARQPPKKRYILEPIKMMVADKIFDSRIKLDNENVFIFN